MVSDEHSQLWPYSQEQLSNLEHLSQRVQNYKRIVKDILYFFTVAQTLEKRLGAEHGKLYGLLCDYEQEMGEGTSDILKAWSHYAQNVQNDIAGGDHQVSTLVIKRLNQLKQELKKKEKQVNRDLQDTMNCILHERNRTVSHIQTHEKYLESKKAEAPGTIHPSVDPWLSERVLYKQLRVMIEEENKFQKEMTTLFQDIAQFDEHVVEELKRILEEYAHAKGSQWSSMQTHTSLAVNIATATEASSQFELFSRQNRFDDPTLWQTPRTIESFPYKTREIKILKKGLLYMPGLFPDKWNPVLAVLTETGFLHCFRLSDAKYRQLLEKYDHKKEQEGWMSTLKRSLTLKSKILMEDVFDHMDKPRAAFSFSLGQPRVNITMPAHQVHLYVFEISAQGQAPQKKFFFSKSKESNVFRFKAHNQQDMIDWTSALQAEVKNLLPTTPPSPLYMSSKKCEENVEQNVQELLKDPVWKSPITRKPPSERIPSSGENSVTLEWKSTANAPKFQESTKTLNEPYPFNPLDEFKNWTEEAPLTA
ncbi:hypothetical protein EDD86DRAFT_207778 [Gorgonomyces haynaldii]|nr:hypothetical protein EDD86DRAFT_207778 [Gorgonomyces haynaldii]